MVHNPKALKYPRTRFGELSKYIINMPYPVVLIFIGWTPSFPCIPLHWLFIKMLGLPQSSRPRTVSFCWRCNIFKSFAVHQLKHCRPRADSLHCQRMDIWNSRTYRPKLYCNRNIPQNPCQASEAPRMDLFSSLHRWKCVSHLGAASTWAK